MHPRKIVALALSGRARKIGGMEPSAAASNPDRASAAAVDRQAAMVLRDGLLEQLDDAMSEFVLVLNDRRQVVFCNRSLVAVHRRPRPAPAVRPAAGRADGLLARAGGRGLRGQRGVRLLRLAPGAPQRSARPGGRSRDADHPRPPARGAGVAGAHHAAGAGGPDLHHRRPDRHQPRKTPPALERIFFHDVLNTVASVRLFADILLRAEPGKVPEMAGASTTACGGSRKKSPASAT